VIVQEDPELVVLKGAVLFGHKPNYIVARIARYTYGVDVMNDCALKWYYSFEFPSDFRSQLYNISCFYVKFKEILTLVQEDPELVVLKGAVLFGHKPNYIVARIARYTYGVDVMNDCNPYTHETGRCVVVNGKKKCKNIFKLYIKTGYVVELGSKITFWVFLNYHSVAWKVRFYVVLNYFAARKSTYEDDHFQI
jgi:hypothetical protein